MIFKPPETIKCGHDSGAGSSEESIALPVAQ